MYEYRRIPKHLKQSKIRAFHVHKDEFSTEVTVLVVGGGKEEFLIFTAEAEFLPEDFHEKVLRWWVGKLVADVVPLLTKTVQAIERERHPPQFPPT